MAVVAELIRSEADGTISFGDYTLDAKAKLDPKGILNPGKVAD